MSTREAERDEALDLLERTRAHLIAVARHFRDQILNERQSVTSTQVFNRMKAHGYAIEMATVDPRWMGAVFRASEGLRRIGWINVGSHARPCAVWEVRK